MDTRLVPAMGLPGTANTFAPRLITISRPKLLQPDLAKVHLAQTEHPEALTDSILRF
jgi:hypothetical protein